MTHEAETLLARAEADGLAIWLDDDKVRYTGPGDAVARWLPVLKDRRDEIIQALASRAAEAYWMWLVRFRDREMQITVTPPATVSELREWYPDAQEFKPLRK